MEWHPLVKLHWYKLGMAAFGQTTLMQALHGMAAFGKLHWYNFAWDDSFWLKYIDSGFAWDTSFW